MNNNDEISDLSQEYKKNIFKTPDYFFENLPSKIMLSCVSENPKYQEKINFVFNKMKLVWVAATLIIFLFSIITLYHFFNKEDASQMFSNFSEKELIEKFDFNSLTENDVVELLANEDLNNEDFLVPYSSVKDTFLNDKMKYFIDIDINEINNFL